MNVKNLNKYDSWVIRGDQVTLKANTPGIIARIEPPKKMGMLIEKYPYLFLKLVDTSGNQLPPNTKVILAGIDQAHDLPWQLSASHYLKPWNDIDYTLQKSEKYIHNFMIDLPQDIFVEEKEQLLIVLISPSDVTLDWNSSEFELQVAAMTMEEASSYGYTGSEFFVEAEDYYPEEDYEE